ncbi:MAG: hypothetical protein WD009_05600 [Phycisphaeraceae bacterium]
MRELLIRADGLLRVGHPGHHAPTSAAAILSLLAVFGFLYGAVMGSYGGFIGELRLLQMLYSGMKVPLLLLVSFTLSLPSFFVINTLLGLRSDFRQALKSLLLAQAGLTLILAALAPFTAFWYLSFSSYPAAILFNGVMFATASFSAQLILRRLYRPLIQRNPRHQVMRWLWLVTYVFVAVQMAWVLRPFIGSPGAPTRLLREEAWGNAYIEVVRILMRLVAG